MKIRQYIQDNRNELLMSMLIALTLAILVFSLIPSILDRSWLPALIMPVIILGAHYRQKFNAIVRVALFGFTLAVVFIFGFNSIRVIRSLIVNPPVWDFHVFWVSGRVASQGLNFYKPDNFHEIAQSLNLDEEFTREILDVGFWYPPMAMFLFAPLGWFDIQTAALLWYILQSTFLILDIFLLWKLFLSNARLDGLVFTSALVLIFPPIINNIWFGQTNFILLCMLLLFWRDRGVGRAGVWLAIGIIIKPYIALLFFYLLLKHQWKVMVYTLITLAVLSLLSLLIFGPTTFFSFFDSNPVNKVPATYFSELGNGSLYALIWRLVMRYLGEGAAGLIQPVFICISIILLALTSWVVYRLAPVDDDWVLAMIVCLALFLYPNTGTNYCGVLMAPILLYWSYRERIWGGAWGVAAFAAMESALFGYQNGWSNLVIAGVVFGWFVMWAIGLSLSVRKTRQPHFVPT